MQGLALSYYFCMLVIGESSCISLQVYTQSVITLSTVPKSRMPAREYWLSLSEWSGNTENYYSIIHVYIPTVVGSVENHLSQQRHS